MSMFKKPMTVEQLATEPNPTFCYRCGKELTDPASIEAGIGPECKEKEAAEIIQVESLIDSEFYLNE